MRLRTRPSKPTPPSPLTLAQTLVFLLGTDKDDARRGGIVKQLIIEGALLRDPDLWTTHGRFLIAEAARLGIARPFDAELGRPAFFGEAVVLKRREDAEKRERRRRGDADDDPAA